MTEAPRPAAEPTVGEPPQKGMGMMRVCLPALLLLALCAGATNAQNRVELREVGGGFEVANGLQVPIVAFVVGRDREGQIAEAVSVGVTAQGSRAVGRLRGDVVRIEDWEVVHLGAPRQKLPANFSRKLLGAVAASDPGRTKAQLKELEISESGLGGEKIALAAEEAQLFLEQRNDERQTFRQDPLRMELERQAAEVDNSYAGAMRRLQVQNERSRNQAFEDVADLAMAYSMAAEAKIEVIERERDLYKPLYDHAKQALVFLRQDIKNFGAEVEAGVTFLNSTSQALQALPGAEGAEIAVQGEVRRLADGPSGLRDLVEIRADAPPSLSVLLAEVQFDRGGTQKTFFRRMAGSDRWVARLYWPLAAASAQFSVQAPGGARRVRVGGRVSPGRPSMNDSFELAEKSMNAVIKKYKETSFRAEGADNIKTVPIP